MDIFYTTLYYTIINIYFFSFELAAVFTAGGLGMINLLPGNPNGIGDIIPVDFVVNHMLLRCSEILNQSIMCGKDIRTGKHHVPISHCATSTMNPVKWRTCEVIGETFLYDNSVHQRGQRLGYRMLNNPNQFAFEWFLRLRGPLTLYDVGTTLLHDGLGLESLADKHINNVQKLKVAINQGERICELFQAFTKKEYFYETNVIEKWIASARNEMTSNNQYPNQYVPSNNPFNVDSTEIVWNTYLQCFAYGIRKYILAEDMTDFPKETLSHYDIQLTTQNINDFQHDHSKLSFPSVFSDLTWTLTHSRKPGYTKRGKVSKLKKLKCSKLCAL